MHLNNDQGIEINIAPQGEQQHLVEYQQHHDQEQEIEQIEQEPQELQDSSITEQSPKILSSSAKVRASENQKAMVLFAIVVMEIICNIPMETLSFAEAGKIFYLYFTHTKDSPCYSLGFWAVVVNAISNGLLISKYINRAEPSEVVFILSTTLYCSQRFLWVNSVLLGRCDISTGI